ncbi:hypothetical protein MHYP_G00134680 [Metynnis hypsauchen]
MIHSCFSSAFMLARLSMTTVPIPPTTVAMTNDPDKNSCVAVTQDDHLASLKALAEKLHLEPRRPSHLEWRGQLETHRVKGLEASVAAKEGQLRAWSSLKWPKSSLSFTVHQGQRHPSESLKGFGSIGEALEWLKKELVSCSYSFVFSSKAPQLVTKFTYIQGASVSTEVTFVRITEKEGN